MKGLTEIGTDIKAKVTGKQGKVVMIVAIILIVIIIIILALFFARMYYFSTGYQVYLEKNKSATKETFKTSLQTTYDYKGDWNPMNYWNDLKALDKFMTDNDKETFVSKITNLTNPPKDK